MEKKNIIKAAWILTATLITILSLPVIHAIPVPHGMDGKVYDLDGVTPASKPLDYSLYDLTTGQYIKSKTNAIGRYSVALNGNDGNIILIEVWNKYHYINATVVLQGVMHNVDILFNLSIPPVPPYITSTPEIQVREGELYSYDVEANDENEEDTLVYSFGLSPNGMTINNQTGLIQWVPSSSQIGPHNVTVKVTDGLFLINQSFVIEVLDIKNPPVIITEPGTVAYQFRRYTYDVNATDADNDSLRYSLLEKPNRMRINSETGLITWIPLIWQVGNNTVIVEVSDGEFTVNQTFVVTVYLFKYWKSGGSDGEKGSSGDNPLLLSTRPDIEVKELVVSTENLRTTDMIISGPKEQYILSGIIYENGYEQVEKGTTLRITNLETGKRKESKTGIGRNTGAFYEIIVCHIGDEVEIEINNAKTIMILKGDMKGITLVLGKDSLSPITGFITNNGQIYPKKSIIILTILSIILLLLFFYGKKRRNGL